MPPLPRGGFLFTFLLITTIIFGMNPIQHFVTTDPLFRYVPNKPAAIEVLQATHRSPDTGHILDRIETLFNKGPMTIRDPLFLKEQFDALIVLAHIAKKITITQLGTAFYWRSALRHLEQEERGAVLR